MNPAAKENDHFDRLPDAVIVYIFNKISDAKLLTLCLSVSKRFASLVPQTGAVSLSFHNPCKPCRRVSILGKFLVSNFLTHLLNLFDCFVSHMSPDDSDTVASYLSPIQVLRHFEEIKSLQIELPSSHGEVGLLLQEGGDDHTLIKWNAVFGSGLHSCVILAARSFGKVVTPWSSGNNSTDIYGQPLTGEELRRVVIWAMSCLIAASERHHLSKQILTQHQTLQTIVISDANKQGMVSVRRDQILLDLRSSVESSKTPLPRTRLPEMALRIKYAQSLELPASGFVMQEATLIQIRAMTSTGFWFPPLADDLFVFDGEEYEKKALNDAVEQLLKIKQTYKMTMDPF